MIQRIQSLYLSLVVIGCICMFFFPIGIYHEYQFSLLGAKQLVVEPMHVLTLNTIPLIIITLAVAILALVIILQYKKRAKQYRLSRILILTNILLIIIIFIFADTIEKKLGETTKYYVSAMIPLVTLLLSFLASRGIRRDEALVKSSDRLR